jgi:hypothetical protein
VVGQVVFIEEGFDELEDSEFVKGDTDVMDLFGLHVYTLDEEKFAGENLGHTRSSRR